MSLHTHHQFKVQCESFVRKLNDRFQPEVPFRVSFGLKRAKVFQRTGRTVSVWGFIEYETALLGKVHPGLVTPYPRWVYGTIHQPKWNALSERGVGR